MGSRRKPDGSINITTQFPPAHNREEREDQMTSLAYELVEQRLRNGTATPTETTFFLRIGSTRERTERKVLDLQCELKAAQAELMRAQKQRDQAYTDVLAALKRYKGYNDNEQYEAFEE